MNASQVDVRRRRAGRHRRILQGGAATAFVLALPACGSAATTTPSSGASTPASAPTSAPTSAPSLATGAASPQCPTAATAGAALGISLPSPVSVSGAATNSLPAGAAEITCEYHAATYNVLIQVLTNVDPSTTISMFSGRFPVPYQSVSGVGDQARSFVQSIGGGHDNEAVVATKGKTLVAITATATPVSLAQIESLVNQLL